MTAFALIRRLVGKSLVVLGITVAIGLAIAGPIAFTVQFATPAQLLLVGAAGALLCFALMKAGDLVADQRTGSLVERAEPLRGSNRIARDRRPRATVSAAPRPASLSRSEAR